MNLTTALAALEGAVAAHSRRPSPVSMDRLVAAVNVVLAAAKSEAVPGVQYNTAVRDSIKSQTGLDDAGAREFWDKLMLWAKSEAVSAEGAVPVAYPSLPAEVREAVERIGRYQNDIDFDPTYDWSECSRDLDTIRAHLLGTDAAGGEGPKPAIELEAELGAIGALPIPPPATVVTDDWSPMESAPHGEPGSDIGSRLPSKWFLALKPNGRQVVTRRVNGMGHDFESSDETYFLARHLIGWRPLPEAAPPSADPAGDAPLCARLRELSHAVTQGPEAVRREFTMRVPAERDRDADLVLSRSADLIERLVRELADERKLSAAMSRDCNATALERNRLQADLAQANAKLAQVERERDAYFKAIEDECADDRWINDAGWKVAAAIKIRAASLVRPAAELAAKPAKEGGGT